jgi:hypothetical protein
METRGSCSTSTVAAFVRAQAFVAFASFAAFVASAPMVPTEAWAQQPGAAAPASPPDRAEPPAPAAGAAPVSADAPAAAEPTKPVVPATGYSYGPPTAYGASAATRADRAPRVPDHGRASPANQPANDAMMTGFETLADGSTRIFVTLSKPVVYETKSAGSTFTVVLEEVRVDRRNNRNPLVTLHFNTPVTSARIVPHGRNLWLVVDLRANVRPAVTMGTGDASNEGAVVLRVGFPKGDYLQPLSEARSTAAAAHPQVSASAATP